VTVWTELVTM